MKFNKTLLALGVVLFAGVSLPISAAEPPPPPPPPFEGWVNELKAEAKSRGISDGLLERALDGVTPIKRVIELDRSQPEFSLTFWSYLTKSVNDARIKKGRQMLAKHKTLLDKVSRKLGVQPRFLVAFWGLESNFGKYTGVFPVVGALSTLAHDRRRAKFFREQLLAVLQLMDQGNFPVDVKGSWAGAMGNHQFIPTTYRDFAYDGDGDGKRDLWNSLPDIFSSAANYLGRSGWDASRTWGREVRLPTGIDLALTGMDTRKSLADWQKLGIRRMNGGDLPKVEIEASVILPAGYQGPAFLIYQNFRTIMVWNRSIYYALAVGHLADRLVGGGPLKTKKPANDKPLSRLDVMDIQRLLGSKGFDTGGVDGRAGPMTRKAIKAFQKSVYLPADGYPSMGLLERLRGS
jgi:membrane-bound lytic murein transglycosylase B